MNEAQKKILLRAIDHFGVEANVNKALEEMSELTTELSRRRLMRFDRDKVAEEIADVLITVEKLRIIYGAAKVDRIVQDKLAALEGEMNGGPGDGFVSADQLSAARDKFAKVASSAVYSPCGSEDAKRQERMMPKGMVVHLKFKPTLEKKGGDKIMIPSCAKCFRLGEKVVDEFSMPYCPFHGVLHGDIKKICCDEYQRKEG